MLHVADPRPIDLDDPRDYVRVLYRVILEREADPGGLDFYVDELVSGRLDRRGVFEKLLASDEGASRRLTGSYAALRCMERLVTVHDSAPFREFVSSDPLAGERLCECANPLRWLDPEWRALLAELAHDPASEEMHRKEFEWAQTLQGMRRLEMLHEGTRCLGVGSGHEPILYWLANHVGEVVATDLYEGEWAEAGALEGDPDVLTDPAKYAPFAYREDRLRFLRMDGRQLDFPDDSFDVVFSLSSIEHFGGNEGAARAMREKARVCRRDGLVVVATDLVLNDAHHPEYFRIEELLEHVVEASGMKLVQEPSFRVPAFALEKPCRMPADRSRTPHLVLDFDGVLTTSVILFLRHE